MVKTSFSFDIESLRLAFARAPEVMMDHLAAGVHEAVDLLWHETVDRTPRASDVLANTILAEPVETRGTVITGRLGTPLEYAEPVETGSRPHWVPIAPLEAWVRRKRLHLIKGDGTYKRPASRKSKKAVATEDATIHSIARRIQRKIGFKGTKGAFMFKGALEANEQQIERILNEAAQRGVEAINRL